MTAIPASILHAERALGRLDRALSDPATHSLWTPDALRREAIASRQIDGDLVALEDFAIARLHSSKILREDIQRAIDLAAAAERWLGIEAETEIAELKADKRFGKGKDHLRIEGDKIIATNLLTPFSDSILPVLDEDTDYDPIEGLDADEDLADLADEPLDYDVILARTKANIAAVEAETAAIASPPEASKPLIQPLSTPWLAMAWGRIIGTPDDDMALLEHAVDLIDEGLQVPGLPGAFGAWHALMQDIWPARTEARWIDVSSGSRREYSDEERARRAAMSDAMYNERAENLRADAEWSMVRLLLPWLIQKACGLERPGPWLSSIMAARGNDDLRRVYWSAQEMPKDRWIWKMCETATKGFAAELGRVDTLKCQLATWEGLAGTRASKSLLGKSLGYKKMERVPSKIIKALPLLIEQPVVNAPWWARKRGIKLRMAQRQLADLAMCGVLDDITTDQRSEKVFMARGMSC